MRVLAPTSLDKTSHLPSYTRLGVASIMHFLPMWLFPSTLCSCLLLSSRIARAASLYALPNTWSVQNTKSSLSLAVREAYASRAAALLVDKMTSSLGTIDGFDAARAAELVSVLALQDWLSGNTTNKQELRYIRNAEASVPGFFGCRAKSWNSDTLYWGLAAYYAHRAYSDDDTSLGLAVNNWQLVTQGFIPANGTLPRSAQVTAGCTGKSLAGGVFLVRDALDDPTIWSSVTAMYITLSAYLHESSNDKNYLSHAEAATSFFQSIFLASQGLAPYSVDVTSCAFDNTLSSWVSGAAIEGLAVLANVTGNSTWSGLLADMLPAAMQSSAPWNTADGRISEDDAEHPTHYQNVLKGMLMRGVLEARRRNPTVADLVNLIDSYITIQFNSALNATVNGTADTYSTSWVGIQDNSTDLTGNVGALDVLNAAFAISGSLPAVTGNGTTSGIGGSGSSGNGGESSGGGKIFGRSSNVGAIAGGVVGGVAGLTFVTFAIFLYRRRCATTAGESQARDNALAADPFPPGSSGSYGTQSRFDRKLATEGGSQLTTLLGSPPTAQTTSSPVASSLSLLNTPRPRLNTADDESPLTPPVQLDPQAIHGLIGQLQGMLRDREEPPPEYIPRDT